LLALLVIAVTVAFAAGCGGDDSGQGGDQGERTAPAAAAGVEAQAQEKALARKRAEAPSEQALEAEEAVSDFYAILGADKAGKKNPDRTTIDSLSFCELMSEEARAQTVHYAKISSGIQREWDCESAVDLLVLRSKRLGGFESTQGAEVIGVNVEGDRATATVRFGKGLATSISLIWEDGEWKLAATPTG